MRAVPHAQAIDCGTNREDEEGNVNQANSDPEPDGAPIGGDAPDGAVPKALREKQRAQDG